MSKKVLLIAGGVLAALGGSCMLCLVAGALTDDGSTAQPAPNAPAAGGLNDGRYACQSLNIQMMGGAPTVQWQVAALPPFTVEGNAYETSSGSGSLSVEGQVVTFTDGPYDGWRGFAGTDGTGPYVLFDGKEHHRVRTDGAKRGDLKCYRQRD
jgi:hypothetical protein